MKKKRACRVFYIDISAKSWSVRKGFVLISMLRGLGWKTPNVVTGLYFLPITQSFSKSKNPIFGEQIPSFSLCGLLRARPSVLLREPHEGGVAVGTWYTQAPDYQLFKWQNVGAFLFLKFGEPAFGAQPTGAEQPAE